MLALEAELYRSGKGMPGLASFIMCSDASRSALVLPFTE